MQTAIVGLAGCGKTTVFNTLTRGDAQTGGFGGMELHVGVVKVPDARLDRLAEIFHPKKVVHAGVTYVDLAAPPASSDGRVGTEDLPAEHLARLRDADALLHVVRMFRDPSVPHPAGTIDPARDVRAMEDEVILADLGVVERRMERLERDIKKANSPDLGKERDILWRCKTALEAGQPLRALGLTADEGKRLRGFQLLSAKPLLLVLNLDEADLSQADEAIRIAGIESFLAGAATRAVPICAKIELEIAQLEPADAAAFMTDLGLRESGLDRVIRASYDLLGYISFFTVGEDECRAWSIPRHTTAVVAAGEIHSDISRGFIRAEVVGYDQLIARGTLAACRDHGELRLEGKEYVVNDGDVINFRHAT
jgi:GTP-binding protein YchF